MLRREHHTADMRASIAEQAFQELVERNEKRFDALLDQQNRIVTTRLGTADRPVGEGVTQPIQLRKPWKNVAASFEAKDRQDYWKARVAEVEAQTAQAMNDKEIAK